MSAPRTLAPVADRLAKVLPRLASDHDGEVLATVKAARRILEAAGMDWNDFAEGLKGATDPSVGHLRRAAATTRARAQEARGPAPTWADLSDSDQLVWLATIVASPFLSEWEAGFVVSILGLLRRQDGFEPTDRQRAVLDRLLDRHVSMGFTPW